MNTIINLLFIVICFSFGGASAANNEFIVGAGIHVGQNKYNAQSAISLLSIGQFNGFRDDFSWGRLEPEFDKLNLGTHFVELNKVIRWAGTKSNALLILGYGNRAYDGGRQPFSESGRKAYARYVEFVAKLYSNNIYGFEIWNEWNIGAGNPKPNNRFGDPQSYFLLVREVAPLLRTIAPKSKVVCGAIADRDMNWLEAILREGVLEYCDAISIHPYVFSEGVKGEPRDAFKAVDSAWTLISKYDKSGGRVQLLITELGWPNHTDKGGRSKEIVAAYAVQSFFLAKSRPWVGGLWWYELINGGDDLSDREQNFGMVTKDQVPKPAFMAIKTLAPVLKNGSVISAENLPGNRFKVRLALPGGEEVTAFWTMGGFSASFHLRQIGGGGYSSLRGVTPQFENQVANIEVGSDPIVIRHPKNSIFVE